MESVFTIGYPSEAHKLTPVISWRPPPNPLVLGGDEVHVWRACLDRNMSFVQNLQQMLSEDEQVRAGRFCFEKDRKRFIVARGLLRVFLSRYLDMEPSQLHFNYNPYGKPSLAVPFGRGTLNFNVSHSCGLALFAVTQGRDVGIDLERICADFPHEQIAERFFSPRENALLRALPEKVKSKAFFNCWTRKEAYIKARGEGLTLPLSQFDVSLAPGESPRLLNNRGDPQEVFRWSFRELIPARNFVATLVVEGHGWRLGCWQCVD